jgi:hypothetical protein
MTKDQLEYRRLTGSIVAECSPQTVMPVHVAVGLIVTHVENMMKDEPTTQRLRDFLIEAASVLLMVEGFYEVVEKPLEVSMRRDTRSARNIKRSLEDLMDIVGEVGERLDAAEAKKAARNGKLN